MLLKEVLRLLFWFVFLAQFYRRVFFLLSCLLVVGVSPR